MATGKGRHKSTEVVLKTTSKIELVETHSIALSLQRINGSNCHGSWGIALYHAIAMSGVYYDREQLTRIREALDLA